MYFYWRVQQDLSCLGEMIIFHEPCFIRALRQWVRKNATGIAQAEAFSLAELVRPSMN
jgi:sulfur relay (sulfurtransferase) DsrC/TusE family protein